MAGFGTIIIIVLLLAGGYYIYANPNLLKQSIVTNPLDQFMVKNNTPSSQITQTTEKVYLGKSWQYYSCKNNEDCQTVFLAGTKCELNQSSNYAGQCYYDK